MTGTLTSRTEMRTHRASRYLQQMAKHFANTHLVPTSFTPEGARIELDDGICTLRAAGDLLTLEVAAERRAGLSRLEQAVSAHLVRFAFREPPQLHWRRQPD